jgi:NitT/TauT family transport system substrate-binding protein
VQAPAGYTNNDLILGNNVAGGTLVIHSKTAVPAARLFAAIVVGVLTAVTAPPIAAQNAPARSTAPVSAVDASLRLDFSINGKHAPFLLGLEKGFYREHSINLNVEEGRGSLAAVQLVANKSNPFAFADSTSVITVAASGGPVKTVGVIQQRSPVVGISFKPLKQPTDLYGMSIGLNPVGVGSLWEAFIAQNHLDTTKMTVVTMDGAALLPALVGGRLDAIIALVNTEGAAAPILAGKDVNLLYFADFGANTLAHGIVVHRDLIGQQADLIKRFMAATTKSWNYSLEHKSEAIDALLRKFPDAKKEIVIRQFELTIPLLHTKNTEGRPIGFTAEQDITVTLDLLAKFGGLKNRPAPADVFTNEFLPATQN